MGEQDRGGRRPDEHEEVEELQTLPWDLLIEWHNELVQWLNNPVSRAATSVRSEYVQRIAAYRGELQRREMVRQGDRMETLTTSLNHLTKWIVGLTVLIAIATIVGLIPTPVAVISGA